jgi:hypothetical protein
MIQYRKTWQNTARIARIIVNAAVCRTFLRSVFFMITMHGDGFIARISQIATAGPTSEIGGFAGLSYTSTSARSMRAMFCELLRRLRCSSELMTDEASIGVIPMPAPYFPAEAWSRSAE